VADQQLTLHVIYSDDGSIKVLDAGGAALGEVTRKADAANIPFRALSQVLAGIGLTGPASMLRMAGSVNQVTGAVTTLQSAALPVLLTLGAILAAVLAVAAAALAWKAAFDFASTATNNAGEQLRNFAGPDGPLGQLQDGFDRIKGVIANVLAKELVRELVVAQTAIVGFLNLVMPVIIASINTLIGTFNAIQASPLAGLLGIAQGAQIDPLAAWTPIVADMSWLDVNKSAAKGDKEKGGGGGRGGAGGVSLEAGTLDELKKINQSVKELRPPLVAIRDTAHTDATRLPGILRDIIERLLR